VVVSTGILYSTQLLSHFEIQRCKFLALFATKMNVLCFGFLYNTVEWKRNKSALHCVFWRLSIQQSVAMKSDDPKCRECNVILETEFGKMQIVV